MPPLLQRPCPARAIRAALVPPTSAGGGVPNVTNRSLRPRTTRDALAPGAPCDTTARSIDDARSCHERTAGVEYARVNLPLREAVGMEPGVQGGSSCPMEKSAAASSGTN